MIDTHGSLSEKFLKKGFWLYLFAFIIAPITYITKIVISNELQVEEVWIIYGILSLIIMLSTFNDFWITESLKHFIPEFVNKKRYDKVKTLLVYAFIIQSITGWIIAAFFFFGAPFISTHYLQTDMAVWSLKIFAFFFLGINIYQTIHTFFLSIQNTFYTKLIDLIRTTTVMIWILAVLFLDIGSLENYSYTWIVWLYVWILLAIILLFRKYNKAYFAWSPILWDKKLFLKIFKYALVVLLWTQAWTILWQIDMQMVLFMLGTLEAWYYTNYISIIGIPYILIGPVFQFLFPVFSELHAKNQHEKIRTIKYIFTKNFMIIAIAMNILFFVFAEIIAYVLFWEKFITSWQILKYSILLLVFNFLLQINFHILAGIWRVKERFHIILAAIGLNFIMNIILIKFIWVYGAALATGFGWIFIYVMSEKVLGKDFSVWFDFKFICKNIFSFTLIWWWLYMFILPLFNNLGRIQSFWFMFILTIIYFSVFALINLRESKMFIWEIKKLRN